MDPSACNYNADAAIDDGGCAYIADGDCDCDGNVDLGCGCGEAGPSGCDNACGSTAEVDECGVCDGDNTSCADCVGTPNGDAEEDACGVCNGDGIPEGSCDCDGSIAPTIFGCGEYQENYPFVK